MSPLQALILAVVEGITEFLPISSTGHLILTSDILGIIQTNFVKSFSIFIQLGAILAVVVLYLKPLIKNPKSWPKIIVAFLPTAAIGLLSYSFVKEYLLGNTEVVLASLAVGGLVLIILELWFKNKKPTIKSLEKIGYKEAIILGLFQSIAIIPGVSRAAATIVGGLILGLNRQTAVEFSFILAIPTMLAASGFDLLKSGHAFTFDEYQLLAIGFVGSFATALVAIKLLLKFVKKHTFIPFGVYRIILAVLFASWWFWLASSNYLTIETTNISPKISQSTASSLLLPVTEASPSNQPYFDGVSAKVPIRVPILTYHYIGTNPNPDDKKRTAVSVTNENFEAQLTYLKDNAFTPIKLTTLYDIYDGLVASPAKPVVLTFDDGYMDFYYNAFPILKKFNVPAVSFIPTGLMNQGYYLTWEQIREMAGSELIEFEDHTVNHKDLRKLTYEEIQAELTTSRTKLQSETGQTILFFAYPYGYYNKTVVTAARDAGFIGGITTNAGISTGKSLTIPRLNVNGYTTLEGFIEKVTLQ